tara:strand:- start:610 stop:837 length:228 start_codon:yes stop_codon:yes gene_type:complete
MGDYVQGKRIGRDSMKAVASHLKESDLARMKRGAKLGEALREAYASILAEPCPDSMLKLLEQLRAEEAQRQNTED